MQKGFQRPIRRSGWAFPLPSFRYSPRTNPFVFWALACSLLLAAVCLNGGLLFAEPAAQEHGKAHDLSQGQGHGHHGFEGGASGWEGSKEGIAYSERNHHLAGFFVLLVGVSELLPSIRVLSVNWARMLLPGALLLMGIFLLVWSDHQAWPIGPLSFVETFFGIDPEIVQHKLYGILSLTVGLIEVFRRLDRVVHAGWMAPLPAFAILGGLMLFAHSHGDHPSAQKIAFDHAIMGTLAISGGATKLSSAGLSSLQGWSRTKGDIVWALCILAVGVQLLFYSE